MTFCPRSKIVGSLFDFKTKLGRPVMWSALVTELIQRYCFYPFDNVNQLPLQTVSTFSASLRLDNQSSFRFYRSQITVGVVACTCLYTEATPLPISNAGNLILFHPLRRRRDRRDFAVSVGARSPSASESLRAASSFKE